MASQIKDDNFGRASLIEIIATSDNSENELQKVYKILGLKWKKESDGYSPEEINELLEK